MPDKSNEQKEVSTGAEPRINIDLEKEDNIEFQRYSTSIKGINLKWYMAICGLRLKKAKGSVMTLNDEDEIREVGYDIDSRSSFIDTSGADCCINLLYGLISHTTQLGLMNDQQIYDLWDTQIDAIGDALLEDYYYNGNTFKMKIDYLNTIIAYCCSYSPYTRKSTGGFIAKLVNELTTNINNIINRGGMQQQKGFWEKYLPIGNKQ